MRIFKFLNLFRMLLHSGSSLDIHWIQKRGLLFVKIAQMYAMRPDIIGEQKARALRPLLQQVTPSSPEDFKKRFEEVAKDSLRDDLEHMDDTPLAVASLGQVHRGRLKNGDEVVVKVTREDFEEAFLKDVGSFQQLLKIAIFFYPRLRKVADPESALEAVRNMTLTEMDLRNESRGIEKLRTIRDENVEHRPFLKHVEFPFIYEEYTNRNVLVSKFIDSPTLSELIDRGECPYEVLLLLFRIHGYYVFRRGVFHGDMHPGNIILKPDGNFVFLDNANIEEAPGNLVEGIMEMLGLIAEGNFPGAAKALHDISLRELSPKRFGVFEQKILKIYENFPGSTVGEISQTEIMMATMKTAINMGMEFPQGAFPLVKSLMYLDGMVCSSHPEAVLLPEVAKFIDDFR